MGCGRGVGGAEQAWAIGCAAAFTMAYGPHARTCHGADRTKTVWTMDGGGLLSVGGGVIRAGVVPAPPPPPVHNQKPQHCSYPGIKHQPLVGAWPPRL